MTTGLCGCVRQAEHSAGSSDLLSSLRCAALHLDSVSGMLSPLLPIHPFLLGAQGPLVKPSSVSTCVFFTLRDGVTSPLKATAYYVTRHHCFTITGHLRRLTHYTVAREEFLHGLAPPTLLDFFHSVNRHSVMIYPLLDLSLEICMNMTRE